MTNERPAVPAVAALPPALMAAETSPTTLDRAARTVEVIWTAGGLVRKMDPATGFQFWEELSTDPAHVRMGRLNGGASVLDTHARYSVDQILGTVVRASLSGERGVATLRFSARAAADAVFTDIGDGIIRHVSVGYTVHRFADAGRSVDGLPVLTAVDWEPFEISMVPVPADAGCGTRAESAPPAPSLPPTASNEDVSIMPTTPAPAPAPATPPAPAPVPQTPPAPAPAAPPAPGLQTPPAPAPADPNDATRALLPPGLLAGLADPVAAERTRGIEIHNAVRAAALLDPSIFTDEYANQLIASGAPLDACRAAVLNGMSYSSARALGGGAPAPAKSPVVQIGVDHADPAALLGRMVDAIACRALGNAGHAAAFPMPDNAREFANYSLLDMAAELASARGLRLGRKTSAELYEALSERSLATSDFPKLLSSSSNKVLQAAWSAATPTYREVAARKTFKDFKPHHFIQMGDFPVLLEVGETANFEFGTISESAESVALGSFGRILRLTRQMIINDDLGGFGELTAKAGQRVLLWENGMVWALLAQNGGRGPTLSDGKPLFHADHGNIGAGGAVSVATVGDGYAKMMLQKSLDGQRLNITPSIILGGALQATTLLQFTTVNTTPHVAGDVNPYAGRLKPVYDAELHDLHPNWWMFAAPGLGAETLVYGGLQGLEGPRVKTQESFTTNGLEIQVAHDFGVGVVDWRGAYLNPGA